MVPLGIAADDAGNVYVADTNNYTVRKTFRVIIRERNKPEAQMSKTSEIYEQDLVLWTEEQGKLLREGKLDEADIENLAEEIESMGRTERARLCSHTQRLLEYLLKWFYIPERRFPSAYAAIVEERTMIEVVLGCSPSLGDRLPQIMSLAYPDARRLAAIEVSPLPDECPWTFEEAMTLPIEGV
jgi:hypothetical protein